MPFEDLGPRTTGPLGLMHPSRKILASYVYEWVIGHTRLKSQPRTCAKDLHIASLNGCATGLLGWVEGGSCWGPFWASAVFGVSRLPCGN